MKIGKVVFEKSRAQNLLKKKKNAKKEKQNENKVFRWKRNTLLTVIIIIIINYSSNVRNMHKAHFFQ